MADSRAAQAPPADRLGESSGSDGTAALDGADRTGVAARLDGSVGLDGGTGTWMLFRSGSATRVDVGLHKPVEHDHSAKAAYVVKECDTAMQDAAERGRLAALQWVARRSGTHPVSYRVSFDLPGVRSGENIGGASGGLAFAVAVARAVAGAGDTGAGAADGADGVGGAIAAAGELESGLSGGPVGSVQGIEAKIEGALARLPAGSRLVYPRTNDPDISAGLRERLRRRGIQPVAVESVDEALDRLFSPSAAVAPPHPGETAGETGSRTPLPPRSGIMIPRVVMIGLAGMGVAAALLFAVSGGDGRLPFTSSPGEDDGVADGGFEAGTGPDATLQGRRGNVTPPERRADAAPEPAVGPAPPAASGDASLHTPANAVPPGTRASRPHGAPPTPADAAGGESDAGFD